MKHLAFFAAIFYAAFSLDEEFFGNIVIPSDISISVDESIYIKIKTKIQRQTSCEYQAPGNKNRNSLDFFVKLTDDDLECGIKIEKVQKSHEGVWKLISTYKNSSFENSIRGTAHVKVKDKIIVSYEDNQVFSAKDNFAPLNVDFNYCHVSKDTGMATKLTRMEVNTKQCMIPQGIEDEDFQNGKWKVGLGIKGVSNEITFSVIIQATDEKIETSIRQVNEKVQLLCKVKNLKNVLTICRFERVNDEDEDFFGLNLEEGIASGIYRYFGQGFETGECGLEIIKPTYIDKTRWNCLVGVTDAADALNDKIAIKNKKVYKYSSVIDASDDWEKLKIINVEPNIYFVDNKSAIMQCNSNSQIDRCWFQHPAQKILSLSDKKSSSDDDNYRYYGDGFQMGHCGIRIKSFHYGDAGEWRCGVEQSLMMKEDVKTIKVEVKASFMMTITKQIEDFSRNSIVLQCRVIPLGALASCHFFSPDGEVFSISEKITSSNAIKGNYYFDPNRKMSSGFCSVVIRELKPQHAGKWICSGRVLGHEDESYDSMIVIVDGVRGASFSYLSLAISLPLAAAVSLAIFGVKLFKKMKERQQVQLEALDAISINTVASNRSSEASNSPRNSRLSMF